MVLKLALTGKKLRIWFNVSDSLLKLTICEVVSMRNIQLGIVNIQFVSEWIPFYD